MKSIKERIEPVISHFRQNMQSVVALTKFDESIIELMTVRLKGLSERLKRSGTNNPKLLPDDIISMLDKIHQHDSLQINFGLIFNQSVVLAVSFLTSVLEEIFKETLEFSISNPLQQSAFLQKEELRLSVKELSTLRTSFEENLASYILNTRGISFQDMQSTVRTFRNYFDIELVKDDILRTVIFVQAARHIIIHSLGITNEKFWKQIEEAVPRSIMPDFKDSKILFNQKNVEDVCLVFEHFVEGLTKKVYDRFPEGWVPF